MPTKTVTDVSFQDDVLNASTPVVIDFWAEWCPPCKKIAPALEELAQEYGERVTIAKINVDDNQVEASKHGIRSIPTFIVYKGGKPIAMKPGAGNKAELKAWIDSVI
jgi:thioredoxin 1